MLEGRGEEKADTGPGWRALAPVSPGCHPSRSRLLTPPGSETSQNRTAGAGRPVQSRGWGLPRPPSGGSHGGAQGPVAVTRPWALPSTPSLEGKGPRLPQEPLSPGAGTVLHNSHPPQVPESPAHHQHPATLTDQCSQLDPRGLPQPSWEVRLCTHPHPPGRTVTRLLTSSTRRPRCSEGGW